MTGFGAVLDLILKEKADDVGSNSAFDLENSCVFEQSLVKLVLFDLIKAARALSTNCLLLAINFCFILALLELFCCNHQESRIKE